MRIRKYKESDAAALARLHRGTIQNVNAKDYPKNVIDSWSGRISAKRFRKLSHKVVRYVAEEQGKTVGFGEIIKENGGLGAMYVHKDWIGKGIGKKLFVVLEKEAIKRKVEKFEFMSSTTAKNFYEACGCKTVKKTVFKLRDGTSMDAYKMEKVLIRP